MTALNGGNVLDILLKIIPLPSDIFENASRKTLIENGFLLHYLTPKNMY